MNTPDMTLRDWFAGQCIDLAATRAEKLAEWELTALFGDRATNVNRSEITAALAYNMADALMKRRERTTK